MLRLRVSVKIKTRARLRLEHTIKLVNLLLSFWWWHRKIDLLSVWLNGRRYKPPLALAWLAQHYCAAGLVRPVPDQYVFVTEKWTNRQAEGHRRHIKPSLCSGGLIYWIYRRPPVPMHYGLVGTGLMPYKAHSLNISTLHVVNKTVKCNICVQKDLSLKKHQEQE